MNRSPLSAEFITGLVIVADSQPRQASQAGMVRRDSGHRVNLENTAPGRQPPVDRSKVVGVLNSIGAALPDSASDEAILAAIAEFGAKLKRATALADNLARTDSERERLQSQIDALKAESARLAVKIAIEAGAHQAALVNAAVADGRVPEGEREIWKRRLAVDFLNEAPLLAALTPPNVESPDGFKSAFTKLIHGGKSRGQATVEAVRMNPGGHAAWLAAGQRPAV